MKPELDSPWKQTTIGSQVTLQRGIDITRTQQRPGKIPVVSSGGISSFHDTQHVNGPGVILGRKGVVGSVYFIESGYWPHDTTLWVKDFHGNEPRFVFYFFKWLAPTIASMDVGSANPTLNRNHVHPIEIVWPPLPEQRAIAHILGTLDDKIENNRRMNETLESMAQALFKSWFVDFDPVRAKMEGREPVGMDAETAALFPDRLVDSEIGEIPEGWGVGTVGEEFHLTMGQSPPGSTYNEIGEGLPFYQGRADFGFRYPTRRVYCTAPTRFASKGDTLVSVRAPVGDINMANERCCAGRGVAAIRHKSGSRSYTYYSMRILRSRFDDFEAEGTVFGSINKNDFSGLAFVVPPVRLVDSFETRMFSFDQQIENQTEETSTLAATRDRLLPKLLSGEVQVSEIKT